jgi:hypothetical protein
MNRMPLKRAMTVQAGTVLVLVVPYSLTFFSHRALYGQDYKDRNRRIHSKDTVVLLEEHRFESTAPIMHTRVQVLHQSGDVGFIALSPNEWEMIQ